MADEPMSAERLAEMREQWQAAQPRSWEAVDVRPMRAMHLAYECMPELLAEVERLRAALDDLYYGADIDGTDDTLLANVERLLGIDSSHRRGT